MQLVLNGAMPHPDGVPISLSRPLDRPLKGMSDERQSQPTFVGVV